MDTMAGIFPEFHVSDDPVKIPWADAVVWTVQPRIGPRVYEWIGKDDIQNVSWVNGSVRIIPHTDSILSDKFQCIVLPAGFITIGKNIQPG
jgi:hypothetical protein